MRWGANVKPSKLITYGLQNITWEPFQKFDQQVKMFYFPILLNSEGMKTGIVSNVDIFFKNSDGEKKSNVLRRVDVQKAGRCLSIDELAPPLPVSIPAGEGLTVTLQARDDYDMIPINMDLICRIAVKYGRSRSSSIEFLFKVTSEDMMKARREVARFQTIDREDPTAEVPTNRAVLKEILEEMNKESQFELILN